MVVYLLCILRTCLGRSFSRISRASSIRLVICLGLLRIVLRCWLLCTSTNNRFRICDIDQMRGAGAAGLGVKDGIRFTWRQRIQSSSTLHRKVISIERSRDGRNWIRIEGSRCVTDSNIQSRRHHQSCLCPFLLAFCKLRALVHSQSLSV
jgi:hypothetical protein